MKKIFILIFIFIYANLFATNYSLEDCQGSLRPYPIPTQKYTYPDSLTPVFINHIGRHGSRYPAADNSSMLLLRTLHKADSIGSITQAGRDFLKVVQNVISSSKGKWGDLDSIGMAEQRGIANRMYSNFPELLKNGKINAIATYSPRAVMSMYEFTHELTMRSTLININTSEGRQWSPILRFFDLNEEYLKFRTENMWKEIYDKYVAETCPTNVIFRLIGKKYPATPDELRDLTINEYYIIAGMSAMGLEFDSTPYLSQEEYNKLWSIFNLRQYLQRCATTLSDIPARISSPLIEEMVLTADSALRSNNQLRASLRFAHAETLMPLFSLLQLANCNYLTYYFDTVATHWKDFYVVPMASNLQLIYFKAPSGNIYVRADLNEIPTNIIPNNNALYIRWDILREYMLSKCLN